MLALRGQGKIPALDGLRGLAIILVYLLHNVGATHSSSAILQGVAAVTSLGWTGVDLFFVLSGFLITGILLETRYDPERARSFYLRRALRIFPVFCATALVVLILAPFLRIQLRAGHIAYLFYGSNFAWQADHSLDLPSRYITFGHLWSLSVEEQFYLMWPMIVWRTSRPTLARICIGMILLSPIARFFIEPAASYRLVHWDGFGFGAIVAILWRSGAALRYGGLSFAAGLAGILVSTRIAGTTAETDALNASIGISCVGFACMGALICALNGGLAARFLSNDLLRLAGRYSYGLYIFHGLWHVPHRRGLGWEALWFGGVTAANIALAVLSFHFLETPFLRLKDKWSHKAGVLESGSEGNRRAAATV